MYVRMVVTLVKSHRLTCINLSVSFLHLFVELSEEVTPLFNASDILNECSLVLSRRDQVSSIADIEESFCHIESIIQGKLKAIISVKELREVGLTMGQIESNIPRTQVWSSLRRSSCYRVDHRMLHKSPNLHQQFQSGH